MILLILAGLCLITGIIFGFFVVGFPTFALIFFGASCLFFILWLLSKMKNKDAAKKIRKTIIILLSIGIIMVAIAEIPIVRNARTDENPEADYLIVLGAGLRGTVPSLALTSRLRSALSYLEEYTDAIAIVSGGQGPGEDITEAEAMRRWLEYYGIAPERIIMEGKSTSTHENLRFSLDIMAERGDADSSIAIVSNEFHLYRARQIADGFGYEASVVSARTSPTVLRVNYFLREAFAVWYMWVFN